MAVATRTYTVEEWQRLTGGNMKATYVDRHGGPDVLTYGDLPDPRASAGQVVVDIHAASVNAADSKVRSGVGATIENFPYVLGRDFSGIVSALGTGLTDFSVGDPVFGVCQVGQEGAYAEKIAVVLRNNPYPRDHHVPPRGRGRCPSDQRETPPPRQARPHRALKHHFSSTRRPCVPSPRQDGQTCEAWAVTDRPIAQARPVDGRTFPTKARGARPTYFDDDGATDAVISMVTALASEVWALRERIDSLESVLESRGALEPGEVEAHRPGPEQFEQRRDDAEAFIGRVLRVFEEMREEVVAGETTEQYQAVVDRAFQEM